MNRRAKIERDRHILTRIVALLFSLALLADMLSRRSRPLRCVVLKIISPIEGFAIRLVMREARLSGAPMPMLWASNCTDSESEALRLALSFRALALGLENALALLQRFSQPASPSEPRLIDAACSILSPRFRFRARDRPCRVVS